MKSKPRFIGLEWLRFLLGLFIMIYHTSHRYPEFARFGWLKNFTGMGFFATSTFFILSGFLLAHVYFNNNEMRVTAKTFWLKRFCNLYPIHIFALVFSVLVLLLMQWLSIPPDGASATPRFVIYDTHERAGETNPELFRHYMTNAELIFNGILQIFMLQAWNPLYLTFNAPLWSVSTLFFFYLVFPFFAPRLLAVKRIKLAIFILLLIYLIPPIIVIFNQLWGVPWTGLIQRFPLFRLPEFLAGILCYALFRHHQQQGFRPGPVLTGILSIFIIGSFILATWLFTMRPEPIWYPLLHNGFLLPTQLTLLYLCTLIPAPRSELLQRYLPRLGASSLSVFALHVPLYSLWRTFEPLLLSMVNNPLGSWQEWVNQAGNTSVTLTGYALFLVFTLWFCLYFQEHFVVRVRNAMLKRLS